MLKRKDLLKDVYLIQMVLCEEGGKDEGGREGGMREGGTDDGGREGGIREGGTDERERERRREEFLGISEDNIDGTC